MALHPTTFEYIKPTDDQLTTMGGAREAFKILAATLDALIPEGPDKTYLMRHLRECSMWAMVAITRSSDGAPRQQLPPSDSKFAGVI